MSIPRKTARGADVFLTHPRKRNQADDSTSVDLLLHLYSNRTYLTIWSRVGLCHGAHWPGCSQEVSVYDKDHLANTELPGVGLPLRTIFQTRIYRLVLAEEGQPEVVGKHLTVSPPASAQEVFTVVSELRTHAHESGCHQ